MRKVTDGDHLSVTPSQGLGVAGTNKVLSHDNAGVQTVGNDIKDEKLQGLGASDSGMFKNQVSCSNGTGHGELRSGGGVHRSLPRYLAFPSSFRQAVEVMMPLRKGGRAELDISMKKVPMT